MNEYKIEAGTAQHIGDRPVQTDRVALFTAPRSPGYLMAVLAEGIQGGATAADQVLHTARQLFDEYPPGEVPNLHRLANLMNQIALEVHTIVKMSPIGANLEPQGTMVILILTPLGQAIWAHIGDSRLYRFFKKECVARSSDAAYVDYLVKHDRLPLESARRHRVSKLLSNVLGNQLKEPFVTIGCHEGLQPGDAFLLASDGLWAYFTDTELASVVHRNTPRDAAQRLISKAIERSHGKGENCSMTIVRLVKPPKEEVNYVVQKMGRAV